MYIVHYMYSVYCDYIGVLIGCCVSELDAKLWPVLLFYKNYIVYYNIYHDYCGVFIEKHVYTMFCLD